MNLLHFTKRLFCTLTSPDDLLTFPESISSRCAADAAFTKADVAAAIDFAASKITSSKFHGASAVSCWKNHVNKYHMNK